MRIGSVNLKERLVGGKYYSFNKNNIALVRVTNKMKVSNPNYLVTSQMYLCTSSDCLLRLQS